MQNQPSSPSKPLPPIQFSKPTFAQCERIADQIAAENAKSPHMCRVSAQELFDHSNKYGGLVAVIQGKVAGFVKLSLLDRPKQIYELGSLMVSDEFRGQRIGWRLLEHMLRVHAEKAIVLITNVPAVERAYEHIDGKAKIAIWQVPGKIRAIIEWPQPLLPNDSLFLNPKMQQKISGNTTWLRSVVAKTGPRLVYPTTLTPANSPKHQIHPLSLVSNFWRSPAKKAL